MSSIQHPSVDRYTLQMACPTLDAAICSFNAPRLFSYITLANLLVHLGVWLPLVQSAFWKLKNIFNTVKSKWSRNTW